VKSSGWFVAHAAQLVLHRIEFVDLQQKEKKERSFRAVVLNCSPEEQRSRNWNTLSGPLFLFPLAGGPGLRVRETKPNKHKAQEIDSMRRCWCVQREREKEPCLPVDLPGWQGNQLFCVMRTNRLRPFLPLSSLPFLHAQSTESDSGWSRPGERHAATLGRRKEKKKEVEGGKRCKLSPRLFRSVFGIGLPDVIELREENS
jgi:hypothetical protein